MANDARISTALPSHPKTKKLIRRLGTNGAWFLVRLFLWAANNRPDGDLSGMTDEDIELAVDWDGEPGEFVGVLAAVEFLDGDSEDRTIHDWPDHNPWANGAGMRSAKARWNAVKRHHGEAEANRQVPEWAAIRGATGNADSNAGSTKGAMLGSNAPSPLPSPSPSPSPIPTEKQARPLRRAMPDGFTPTDDHKQLAKQLNVNIDSEFQKFVDYHAAKGSTFKDWNAALRTWLRNAQEFAKGKGKGKMSAHGSHDETVRECADWFNEQQGVKT